MKPKSVALALLVMALWGSLFPFVKVGYDAFGIASDAVSSILLFAGLRFVVSGAVIMLIAKCRKMEFGNLKKVWVPVLISGVFSVTVHYSFQYLGLSIGEGSKSAIVKQIGSVIAVFASAIFFKSDKLTWRKILGAVIGFAGIVCINYNSGFLPSKADGFIVLGTLFSVAATFISKNTYSVAGPIVATGVSQFAGGLLLCLVGLMQGGSIRPTGIRSVGVMAYICTASVVSYCVWYSLVGKETLSRLYITKFAEPVFAAVLSAVMLGENPFRWEYLLAFVCISGGIMLCRQPDKAKKNEN